MPRITKRLAMCAAVEALMVPFQDYEYSHLSENGGCDYQLVARICADVIIDRLPLHKYKDHTGEAWERNLHCFISDLIYRSNLTIRIAIGALVLADRLQKALIEKDLVFTGGADVGCRIFLICYIIASKITYGEEFTQSYWKLAAGRQYDFCDLSAMDFRFYEAMGWNVDVDLERPVVDNAFDIFIATYDKRVAQLTLPASPLPSSNRPWSARRRSSVRRRWEQDREVVDDDDLPDEEEKASTISSLPLPATAIPQVSAPQRFINWLLSFRSMFQLS